jgi:uncharacterized membrane protein YeaQ/YmgE (transglycosylase-associated protein family)
MVQCGTCNTVGPTTLLWWQATSKRASLSIRQPPEAPSTRAVWRKGDQNKLAAHGEGQTMAPETIIIWLVIGAVAGWLAGQIVKGGGFGLVGDIVVGIIGSVVAGWLLPRVGLYIGGGFIAEIINAVIGAVVLLIVVRLVKR